MDASKTGAFHCLLVIAPLSSTVGPVNLSPRLRISSVERDEGLQLPRMQGVQPFHGQDHARVALRKQEEDYGKG